MVSDQPMPSGKAHAKGHNGPRRGTTGNKRSGRGQCGAKTKTCDCGHHRRVHAANLGSCLEDCDCLAFSPKSCTQRKVLGRTRCRMHGGTTGIGPSHPAWKHGRWSRAMAGHPDFQQRYLEALSDPVLETNRRMQALLDATIEQLLTKMKAGKMLGPADRREIVDLTSALRMLQEAESRIEQRKNLTLPMAIYTMQIEKVKAMMLRECVTDDGQPRFDRLKACQQELLALSAAVQPDVIEGEVLGGADGGGSGAAEHDGDDHQGADPPT